MYAEPVENSHRHDAHFCFVVLVDLCMALFIAINADGSAIVAGTAC